MPVYQELDSATSDYITDFDVLFASFFGFQGSQNDISKMHSYSGLITLMKKYMTSSDQGLVIDGLAELLWGKGAQGLTRNDPQSDYKTKLIAFNYLLSNLKVRTLDKYQIMIDTYYKGYK